MFLVILGLEEEGLYRIAGVSSKFNNLVKLAIGITVTYVFRHFTDSDFDPAASVFQRTVFLCFVNFRYLF